MSCRELIESQELQILSKYATASVNSKGRKKEEEPDLIRTCFMRDRDRIIHTKAFRRLIHKTQVYITPNNDHYRTRLTHTLEVNQIAKTIGRALNLNCDLIEAMALGHDVGHTPFAHTGEEVLNELMPGGFRHNENSIRVLTKLEKRSNGKPLNLTEEVLDGILHHSGFDTNKNLAKTLEGQVVRLSDKIAYIQHDIDDSMRAGVLSDIPDEYKEILGNNHGKRINTAVNDIIYSTAAHLSNVDKGIKTDIRIVMSPGIESALKGLRDFMFSEVYNGGTCNLERQGAKHVVETMFNYYKINYDKLPKNYQLTIDEEGILRAVCDYISGMTDNYLISLFEDKFMPKSMIGGS